MTTTEIRTGRVRSGGTDLWYEQRGDGPDVVLVAGLGDPAEVWDEQLRGLSDRYRVTAFDNPGAGRSPLPDGELSLISMADGTAALIRELGLGRAHVAGFSGGSLIAQAVGARHPDVVRSLVLVSTFGRPDAYGRTMLRSWRWLPDGAPSERAMLEAFYLWIYTARAHADGTVARLIDQVLAHPHPQSGEAFQRQLDAFTSQDLVDELPRIAAPTLVLAGGVDISAPPRLGAAVAARIPGARFEVLPDEAHQPFQEVPDVFNARLDAFWREVEAAEAS